MKRNQLVTILLVFMLSFSIAHAFVLDENHQHVDCHGCIIESEHHVDSENNHVLHCEFHSAYILSDKRPLLSNEKISSSPSFIPKSYTYYQTEKLIKPPIA